MRFIPISILVSFSFAAQALDFNTIQDVMERYESKDINQKCEVSLSKLGDFELKSYPVFGNEVRESFSRKLDFVSHPGTQTWIAHNSDYDGQAMVYFIQRPYELVVIANFESFELDKDIATFCHLPIKKN